MPRGLCLRYFGPTCRADQERHERLNDARPSPPLAAATCAPGLASLMRAASASRLALRDGQGPAAAILARRTALGGSLRRWRDRGGEEVRVSTARVWGPSEPPTRGQRGREERM